MASEDAHPDAHRLAELERRLSFLENELAHLRERLEVSESAAARLAHTPPAPLQPVHIDSAIDRPPTSPTATPSIPASIAPLPLAPRAFEPAAIPAASRPAPAQKPASSVDSSAQPADPPSVLGSVITTFLDQRREKTRGPANASAAPAASTTTTPPASKPIPPKPASSTKPASRPTSISAVEQALGGRWYALIGAVIVLIGLGLFLKLAVEQHWLAFPPAWRCAGVALAGLALLGAGEWARRKLTLASSAGFSAAGIGALIASVWAAHRLYDLTGELPAFILMAAACALGVFVAARAGLASVAVVSLLGAYLNPLIVGDTNNSKIGFFAYLLLVLATGLALPIWKGRVFRAVRSLVWWGTTLMGGIAATRTIYGSEPVPALVFVSLAWFMIQTELAVTAGRFGIVGRNQEGFEGPPKPLRSVTHFDSTFSAITLYHDWRPIASSFSSTAWVSTLASLALGHIGAIPTWLAPAFFCAVTLAAAHILSGHLRFLTDVPDNDSDRLGASFALQAGGLLITAISMALSGGIQVVAWLALGACAIAAGRWIRSRALDVYGLITLSIGTARLVIYDSNFGPASLVSSDALGLALGPWTLFAIVAAAAWLTAAWLLRPLAAKTWLAITNICVAVGITLFALAPTLLTSPSPVGMVFISAVAAGLAWLAIRLRSQGLSVYSLSGITLSTLIAIIYTWRAGSADSLSLWGLIFTQWNVALLVIVLAWLAAAWLIRHLPGQKWKTVSDTCVAVGFTLIALAPSLLTPPAPAGVALAAVVALSLLFMSTRLASFGLAIYASTLLILATCVTTTYAWLHRPEAPAALWGLVLTTWNLTAACVAACWAAARSLRPARAPAELWKHLASTALVLALIHLPVNADGSAASISIAWLAISLTALTVSYRARLTDLALPASSVVFLAEVAWLAEYSPLRGRWPADAAPALLSKGLLTGLALTAGASVAAWLSRTSAARSLTDAPVIINASPRPGSLLGDLSTPMRLLRAIFPALATSAVIILWLSTSMEAGRIGEIISSDRTVQRAAVSVWWGMYGLGLISAGFLWKTSAGLGVPTARRAGLALVALAVLKALIWDLIQVPPLARVVSFVGLGLLMMAVTVIYAKLAGRLGRGPSRGTSGDAGEPFLSSTPQDEREPVNPSDPANAPPTSPL